MPDGMNIIEDVDKGLKVNEKWSGKDLEEQKEDQKNEEDSEEDEDEEEEKEEGE